MSMSKPYRNQQLRDFAKDCPHCMVPGCDEDPSTIVMAHSNSLRDGKGIGVKASDVPCYVGFHCHRIIDGLDRPEMTPFGRELLRLQATYNSILWLLETERLKVCVPNDGSL